MDLKKDITQLNDVFYHGTTSNHIESLANNVRLDICNPQTDFSQGFYLTSNLEQARKWAFRKEREHNLRELGKQKQHSQYIPHIVKGVVLYYKVDTTALKILNNLHFDKHCLEWANFVYANRSYNSTDLLNNKDAKFDVVYGPVADGKFIMGLTQERDEGIIGLEDYLEGIINLKYLEKGYDQLSIHTPRALECIKYEKVVLTHVYPSQKTRVR